MLVSDGLERRKADDGITTMVGAATMNGMQFSKQDTPRGQGSMMLLILIVPISNASASRMRKPERTRYLRIP